LGRMDDDPELGLGGRLLEWWSLGAFIVSAVDHSYLVALLLLWPTISLYPSTTLVVPVMRRAFADASRTSTSKTSLSSFPSTLTCSTPSNLSASHYKEHAAGGALPTPRTEREILSSANLKAFTFSDLKSATRNFRTDSLIGEGGFGCVYKGWIDEQSLAPSRPGSGMVVAIKKLKPEGFQGHKEWLV
ncbi:hypothetical protein GW17_00042024, partial [Ensete ventricosum]